MTFTAPSANAYTSSSNNTQMSIQIYTSSVRSGKRRRKEKEEKNRERSGIVEDLELAVADLPRVLHQVDSYNKIDVNIVFS